ncbi:MAG TPA: hypothetical protein VHF58_11745 [Solirubrobacterales bacterium]|nr:hypothetical protein [Solirubrobacterales bacterium]
MAVLLVALAAPATIALARSDERPGFDRAACSGRPFPIDGLSAPTGAQRGDSGAAAALREVLEHPPVEIDGRLPKHRWRLIVRKPALAVFGSGDASRINLLTVRKRQGAWEFAGYDSHCKPVVVKNGIPGETWTLDPTAPPPDPATSRLALLVRERNCNSGDPPEAERILPPRIDYTRHSITITYRIEPPEGFQTCPGAPPAAVTLPLSEAVGDRVLRDGGFVVPRERHP